MAATDRAKHFCHPNEGNTIQSFKSTTLQTAMFLIVLATLLGGCGTTRSGDHASVVISRKPNDPSGVPPEKSSPNPMRETLSQDTSPDKSHAVTVFVFRSQRTIGLVFSAPSVSQISTAQIPTAYASAKFFRDYHEASQLISGKNVVSVDVNPFASADDLENATLAEVAAIRDASTAPMNEARPSPSVHGYIGLTVAPLGLQPNGKYSAAIVGGHKSAGISTIPTDLHYIARFQDLSTKARRTITGTIVVSALLNGGFHATEPRPLNIGYDLEP